MATAPKPPAAAPERPGRPPEAALELRAPLRPRGRRRGRLELPAALVPGEGLQGLARLELLVLARHRLGAALLLLLVLSGLPLLFLYVPSVERAYGSVKDIEYVVTFGSWIRAVHRISAHLMVAAVFLHLVRVFLTGAYKNGVGPRPAARVELGDRRRDAAADALPVVHRLPAALGPARLLGGHRRHQHRVVDPVRRAAGARAADRRPRRSSRPTLIRFYVLHVIVLPRRARRALRATTCGASARTAASPAPTAWRAARDGGRGAAGRRPRPTRCSASRAARRRRSAPRRSRRRDLTVNAVPDLVAARRDRHARHLRRHQHPVGRSSARRSRSRPTRWSRRTRPRRPGTSSGCRRSSPTRPSTSGRFTINGAFVGGVILPGLLIGAADRLALARPQPGRGRPASGSPRSRRAAEPRLPAARARRRSLLTIVGTFMRGPYWHFYWPWQAWPEHPDEDLTMETAHRLALPAARPARARRRSASLLVVSTVLFAAQRPRARLALLPGRVQAAWSPRSSAPSKATTVPSGMQQIWVPALGRADRCVTCHQATQLEGLRDGRAPVPHAPAASR